jgi:hypothetical protein
MQKKHIHLIKVVHFLEIIDFCVFGKSKVKVMMIYVVGDTIMGQLSVSLVKTRVKFRCISNDND